MNKNEILIAYGTHYKEMTKYLLAQAKIEDMIPSKDTLIGIKPNLVSAVSAEDGGTTHPEVVEALIEYLQMNDYRNIVMLESSWVGEKTEDAIAYCGYDRISEKYQVPFWDMQKESSQEVDCAGLKLNICKRALDIEYLINVPVLKGHCQTKITCALKNMKGLIPNSEKRRFHRLNLHDPIGHLSAGITQNLILVDSICGDLTFEDGGNPVQQDRIMLMRDPVLCDTYCCGLLDIPVEEVGYINIAAELGVGSKDLSNAAISCWKELLEETAADEKETQIKSDQMRSSDNNDSIDRMDNIDIDNIDIDNLESIDNIDGIETVYFGKIQPSSLNQNIIGGYRHVMKLAEKTDEVDSCSACYGYLIPALEMLERDGLLDRIEEKICIGQGHRGKSGELGIGNCTRGFRHSLEGCPPTENQIYEFLKNYVDIS